MTNRIITVLPRDNTQAEALDITPSTTAQKIPVRPGGGGYAPVRVAAVTADIDPNIIPDNIRGGVEILGVVGSAGDEYNNVVDVENIMRGTDETATASIEAACNNISQFLYGNQN